MNRRLLLLVGLGALLLVVIWYFMLFSPKNDEIAEIEEQIASTEQQVATVRAQIRQLEAVRDEAPRIEAALVAAESVIPRDPALPATLRQLQLAADDSGVRLVSVTPGRPRPTGGEEVPAGLSTLALSVQLEGGYFQIVDFLRRIENPAITARGILWEGAVLSPQEYPTLSAALNGSMFSVLPVPAEEPAEGEEPADGEAPAEGGTEAPTEAPTEAAAAAAETGTEVSQ